MASARVRALGKATGGAIPAAYAVPDLAVAVEEAIYNAIDAKARHVQVEVDLVRVGFSVADDGDGIDPDAIYEHLFECAASSKAERNCISYGRRGKYLMSLAALAKSVELESRTKDDWTSYRKVIKEHRVVFNARSRSVRPGKGTTLSVKGLFHELPVRQRDLQRYATARARIAKQLSVFCYNMSMIWPTLSIDVAYRDDAKPQSFRIAGLGSCEARLITAYGETLGRELEYVCFQPPDSSFTLRGYVAVMRDGSDEGTYLTSPGWKQARAYYQMLFLDNMWLADVALACCKTINHEAIATQLGIPIFVLKLSSSSREYEVVSDGRGRQVQFKQPEQLSRFLEKFVEHLVARVHTAEAQELERAEQLAYSPQLSVESFEDDRAGDTDAATAHCTEWELYCELVDAERDAEVLMVGRLDAFDRDEYDPWVEYSSLYDDDERAWRHALRRGSGEISRVDTRQEHANMAVYTAREFVEVFPGGVHEASGFERINEHDDSATLQNAYTKCAQCESCGHINNKRPMESLREIELDELAASDEDVHEWPMSLEQDYVTEDASGTTREGLSGAVRADERQDIGQLDSVFFGGRRTRTRHLRAREDCGTNVTQMAEPLKPWVSSRRLRASSDCATTAEWWAQVQEEREASPFRSVKVRDGSDEVEEADARSSMSEPCGEQGQVGRDAAADKADQVGSAHVSEYFSIEKLWHSHRHRTQSMSRWATRRTGIEASIAIHDADSVRVSSIPNDLHTVPSSLKLDKALFARLLVLGQVDRKFILVKVMPITKINTHESAAVEAPVDAATAQSRGVLLCVDQHAADERVRLEQLEARVFGVHGDEHNVDVVEPRAPIALALNASERESIAFFGDTIQSWGFTIEIERGGDRAWLTQVPKIDTRIAGAGDFREYLQLLASSPPSVARLVRPPVVTRFLHSRACRSAIMFGDYLSVSQCRDLMGELRQCRLPFQCAHGRPSVVPLVEFQ